jgi:hypothetical protein
LALSACTEQALEFVNPHDLDVTKTSVTRSVQGAEAITDTACSAQRLGARASDRVSGKAIRANWGAHMFPRIRWHVGAAHRDPLPHETNGEQRGLELFGGDFACWLPPVRSQLLAGVGSARVTIFALHARAAG